MPRQGWQRARIHQAPCGSRGCCHARAFFASLTPQPSTAGGGQQQAAKRRCSSVSAPTRRHRGARPMEGNPLRCQRCLHPDSRAARAQSSELSSSTPAGPTPGTLPATGLLLEQSFTVKIARAEIGTRVPPAPGHSVRDTHTHPFLYGHPQRPGAAGNSSPPAQKLGLAAEPKAPPAASPPALGEG